MSEAAASAVQEIVSPLAARCKAGKAGLVVVLHPGVTAPEQQMSAVEAALGAEGFKVERVSFGDLGPNPIAALTARNAAGARSVFSVVMDHLSLVRDEAARVKALNLHRNNFTKNKLCCVLWLAAADMPILGKHASNFLDFRTRLVDLTASIERGSPKGPPSKKGKAAPPSVRITELTWDDHHAEVMRVAWSHDGERLAAGFSDGSVRIWSQETQELLSTLQAEDGPIIGLTWASGSSILATKKAGGRIKIWDAAAGKLRQEHEGAALWRMSLSPDGKFLAFPTSINTLRVVDLSTGNLRVELSARPVRRFEWSPDSRQLAFVQGAGVSLFSLLTNKINEVPVALERDLAWSQDGRWLACDGLAAVTIIDTKANSVVRELETEDRFGDLAFACNGKLLGELGSESRPARVEAWSCTDWTKIVSANATDTSAGEHVWTDISGHPTLPQFALALNWEQRIQIWEFDQFLQKVASEDVAYTNAKIVLLGDSGVGKSGLSLALTEKPFRATESTHGREVFLLDRQEVRLSDGKRETREVFLWDLAGQPGYRIIHQLHLHDATVALVVFDSRSETDPLGGVRHWDKALRQAQRLRGKLPLRKLLVAARADRGGAPISRARAQAVIEEMGFDGYYETSARSGMGIPALLQAAEDAIDWDALPRVSSTKVLVTIKEFLIDQKGKGRILSKEDDLFRAFQDADLLPPSEEDLRPQFASSVLRLESQGLLRRFSFGQLVLLQPERLDAYGSALVQAARDEPDGLGCIAESAALAGQFNLSEDQRLTDHEDEKLLLVAVDEDLLSHDLALREGAEDGPYLVFPSQLTRERPDLPDPPGKAVVFSFEGSLLNIYARVVVRLSRSGAFRKKELWRNAATFSSSAGGTGACGLWLREIEEGTGELLLFFENQVEPLLRAQFEEYVRTHLERYSLPDSLGRRAVVHCPSCGTVFTDSQVQARRGRGHDTMRCSVCDHEFSLKETASLGPSQSQAVAEMERTADRSRAREVAAARLRGKRKTEDFDVFLSYRTSDRPAVIRVAKNLEERGFLPWLDIWQLPAGRPFQRELERQIEKVKAAAVFIGADGMGPWQEQEHDALIRQFVKRGCPVIPVVLRGVHGEPALPTFLSGMIRVDFRKRQPPPLTALIAGITGRTFALHGGFAGFDGEEFLDEE